MMIFIGIPVLAFLIYDIIRRHLETVRAQKECPRREAKLEQLHSFQEKEADTGKEIDEIRYLCGEDGHAFSLLRYRCES